jgi:type III secretion system YopN/LcrE/InvE/MxiC family regulator
MQIKSAGMRMPVAVAAPTKESADAAGKNQRYKRATEIQGAKQNGVLARTNKTRGMGKQDQRQLSLRQGDARHQANAAMAGGFGSEDLSPAAQLQEFINATEFGSMLASQFRNRRDLDKKTGESSEHFAQLLDEEGPHKIQQLMKIAKAGGLSAEDFLQRARTMFPDVSDLIIVLRELLRRRNLDAIVRARLMAALKQAEQDAPPRALKAGVNIALKARLFGAKLALSASLLRATYRQFLESEALPTSIYEDWIATYGHERRALVLEFLEAALVADMLAQDPSCSRVEFGNLLGKLNQLKLLRSVEAAFVAGLLADPAVVVHNGSEADWLLFMLAMLQAPEQLDALLMDTIGASAMHCSHAERSTLLQAVRHACGILPHVLMSEEDAALLWQRFDLLAGIAFSREMIEARRKKHGRGRSGDNEDNDDNEDNEDNEEEEGHDHV